MNVRAIAVTTSAFISLLAVSSMLKLNFPLAEASAISQQTQVTAINLGAAELKKSLMLRISSSQSLTRATGDIKVNGRLLKKLSRTSTQLDLAPNLKLGKNIVTVSGQYSPASAAIEVELVSANNHVSQKMAGSGTIKQTLAIEVE
jgi:hypothetical protein